MTKREFVTTLRDAAHTVLIRRLHDTYDAGVAHGLMKAARALETQRVVFVPDVVLDRLVGLAELTEDVSDEEREAVEWGVAAVYELAAERNKV